MLVAEDLTPRKLYPAILPGESQRVEGMSVIYTIGYEGTDIDRCVATLKAVGVTVLADVRAVAVSRKKGFSKNGLRERLEAEGITYVHLVELGDQSKSHRKDEPEKSN